MTVVVARPLVELADRLRTRGELVGVEITGPGWIDVPVTGVTIDSRRVRPGDCFVAIAGAVLPVVNWPVGLFAGAAIALYTRVKR